MGLLSTVGSTTSLAHSVGYSALVSVGGGFVYAITYFPVLAPLPVSESAYALAFFAFCRAFAGVGADAFSTSNWNLTYIPSLKGLGSHNWWNDPAE